MGLKDDLDRYRKVGEQEREDLSDFIAHGDLGQSRPDSIQIPIKIIDLPEFEYSMIDQGGVGQGQGEGGQPQPGQPAPQPQPGDGDGDEEGDGDEPGDGEGEHGYYDMDPEEFAEQLDEELGLDLDPKGKKVVEEKEGDYNDIAKTGPSTLLDFEELFKKGMRRKIAMDYDENFLREALKVDGMGPEKVFEWARTEENMPVSKAAVEELYDDILDEEKGTWESMEDMQDNVEKEPVHVRIRRDGVKEVPFRKEDERYRHPEIVEEKQNNVVVVNIRDVSGSMRASKRELVERVMTPMDWYLQGKYDHAEFIYIAHDAEAWEVEREEFFGIQSGGGTQISSAYDLAEELLEEYPFSEWNRYVFAAGDGENSSNDTQENVIPMMEDIDANQHAYIQTNPGSTRAGNHGEQVEEYFEGEDNVKVAYVDDNDDVIPAIEKILSRDTED